MSSSSSTTTTQEPQTREFQAQVQQILDLVVHSLYSQKEVFLRELISNSVDATEKRRLLALENPELADEKSPEIWLSADSKAKTLTISDRGIGMSREEVERNIGTIAHSGTREFAERLGQIKENPELIGQFGVGFYASFMVAEKVELHTRKAGEEQGTLWQSQGDGSYTISAKPKDDVGTAITLHLKVFDPKEEGEATVEDFTDSWALKQVVKKYSDFVEIPIKMMVEKNEPVLDSEGKAIEGKFETKEVEETLNAQRALWRQPASKISEEEYTEFYKSVCRDWSDPLDVIHYKAEGAQDFLALLFVPSQVPFDYHQREAQWGPSLYIKKVFITDNITELLPAYLRFIKGVVDSDDIPLNVSREMLQKDHRLQALSKALVFKVLKHFETMLNKKRSDYEKLWNLWGITLKEGLAMDLNHKERLEKIVLFRTSLDDRLTTLDEYIGRMPAEQKAIYYLTGDSLEHLKVSPYMETFKQRKCEVLMMVDPVDEWVMQSLRRYQDFDMVNASQENLDLPGEESEAQKKEREQQLTEKNKEYEALCTTIQAVLAEHIKEVKLSTRLVDSPVCLVNSQNDPSMRMERIMGAMGQKMPKTKRVLEIHPGHPVIQRMKLLGEATQKQWADILYHQALLNEGSSIDNPVLFTQKINDLMTTTAAS